MIGQNRSSQRYTKVSNALDMELIEQIIKVAEEYGRYGYRMVTYLLRNRGYQINHKRVERIWREEGLKVPRKQPKRKRLWLESSSVRMRPEHPNHVWSYDFVEDKTSDKRKLRVLNVIDEFSRECLAMEVGRKLNSNNVIECLGRLFIDRAIPENIRSDNGSEFTAKSVRRWMNELGVNTLFIEPGSPWENGYIESFNGKFRNELLNGEIFDTLFEAQVIIENWRIEYNTIRPHSSLGGKPPAPKARQTVPLAEPIIEGINETTR